MYIDSKLEGALAWVVGCQLHTAEVWIQTQVTSSGIHSGPSGTAVDFLQVFQFPLPIIIPPVFHIHLSSRDDT